MLGLGFFLFLQKQIRFVIFENLETMMKTYIDKGVKTYYYYYYYHLILIISYRFIFYSSTHLVYSRVLAVSSAELAVLGNDLQRAGHQELRLLITAGRLFQHGVEQLEAVGEGGSRQRRHI